MWLITVDNVWVLMDYYKHSASTGSKIVAMVGKIVAMVFDVVWIANFA